jgi:hypothetical protein
MFPIPEGRIRKYKSRRCNKILALEKLFKGLVILPFPVLIKGM